MIVDTGFVLYIIDDVELAIQKEQDNQIQNSLIQIWAFCVKFCSSHRGSSSPFSPTDRGGTGGQYNQLEGCPPVR